MTPLQWKRLFYRIGMWACILGLAVLLIVVGVATWRVYSKGQDARGAYLDAVQALDELNARQTAIEGKLQKLNTDRGIEEEVRGRYQLAKPGEEVIVLVDSESGKNATTSQVSKGFWQSFLGWFSW